MDLISIIIPVYNAELYLEECLYSIIEQTYSELEIILINDGSTDSSGKLCNAIAKKDERISVLHISNNGASHARNLGIENSNGNYILFINADDKITPHTVETLINTMLTNEVDIVVTSFTNLYIHTGKSEKHDMKYSGYFDSTQIKSKILSDCFFGKNINNFDTSCWAKLFKRDIIINHQLKFDTLLKYGEDTLFVFEYLISAKNAFFLNSFFPYIYVIHEQSLSGNFELNRYQRRKYMILKYHEKLGVDYLVHYNRIYFLMMLDAYYPLSQISYAENKSLLKYELQTMLTDNELNASYKYVDKTILNIREKLLLFLSKYKYLSILLLFIKGKNMIYNFQK